MVRFTVLTPSATGERLLLALLASAHIIEMKRLKFTQEFTSSDHMVSVGLLPPCKGLQRGSCCSRVHACSVF